MAVISLSFPYENTMSFCIWSSVYSICFKSRGWCLTLLWDYVRLYVMGLIYIPSNSFAFILKWGIWETSGSENAPWGDHVFFSFWLGLMLIMDLCFDFDRSKVCTPWLVRMAGIGACISSFARDVFPCYDGCRVVMLNGHYFLWY